MNTNRSNLYESFLQLVRLGIGTSKGVIIPKDVDWYALKDFADKQELSAVILDALNTDGMKLSDGMPLAFKLEWIGEVLQEYEGRYEQYKKAIGSLAGFYNQHGFKMMVLKGYACSLDWPKPNHRPCGDIDIWQFGKQKEADEVLNAWFSRLASSNERQGRGKVQGSSQRVDTSEHHHTVFYWKDFMVENHYDFINVHHHKSHAEYERILKDLGKDDSHYTEVNGGRVFLPSPNLHALFLFKHLMLHFTTGEITLRQVLDWAFFVKKHGSEVDWSFVMGILEKHGLMRMFNVINAICVEDLEFKVDIFPMVQFNPILKDRVIEDVFNPKFAGEMPKNVILRIIYKYKRWKANEWKHELCYKESMWSAFWSGVWSHILKPKSI